MSQLNALHIPTDTKTYKNNSIFGWGSNMILSDSKEIFNIGHIESHQNWLLIYQCWTNKNIAHCGKKNRNEKLERNLKL